MQAYSDASKANDPYALPDVEVFYASQDDCDEDAAGEENDPARFTAPGWYFWTCFPDCLPDSDPTGPYETEEAALIAARESEGYCPHGVAPDVKCVTCDPSGPYASEAEALAAAREAAGSAATPTDDRLRHAAACALKLLERLRSVEMPIPADSSHDRSECSIGFYASYHVDALRAALDGSKAD